MRVTEGRFALEGNSDGRGHDGRVGRRDRPGAIGRGIARSVGSSGRRVDRRPGATGHCQRTWTNRRALRKRGSGERLSSAGNPSSGGAQGATGAGDRRSLGDATRSSAIVVITYAEPDPGGDATTPGRDSDPISGADPHAESDAETHQASEEPEAHEVAAAVILRAMLLQRTARTSTRP